MNIFLRREVYQYLLPGMVALYALLLCVDIPANLALVEFWWNALAFVIVSRYVGDGVSSLGMVFMTLIVGVDPVGVLWGDVKGSRFLRWHVGYGAAVPFSRKEREEIMDRAGIGAGSGSCVFSRLFYRYEHTGIGVGRQIAYESLRNSSVSILLLGVSMFYVGNQGLGCLCAVTGLWFFDRSAVFYYYFARSVFNSVS